jgi:hypothetical protein
MQRLILALIFQRLGWLLGYGGNRHLGWTENLKYRENYGIIWMKNDGGERVRWENIYSIYVILHKEFRKRVVAMAGGLEEDGGFNTFA